MLGRSGVLTLGTILSMSVSEPLKISKKKINLRRPRTEVKNLAAMHKTDKQGDSGGREAE